jgi:hypothetical protein
VQRRKPVSTRPFRQPVYSSRPPDRPRQCFVCTPLSPARPSGLRWVRMRWGSSRPAAYSSVAPGGLRPVVADLAWLAASWHPAQWERRGAARTRRQILLQLRASRPRRRRRGVWDLGERCGLARLGSTTLRREKNVDGVDVAATVVCCAKSTVTKSWLITGLANPTRVTTVLSGNTFGRPYAPLVGPRVATRAARVPFTPGPQCEYH